MSRLNYERRNTIDYIFMTKSWKIRQQWEVTIDVSWLFFLINKPEKNTHVRRENKKHETIVNVEHKKKARTQILKNPSSRKDSLKSLTQ